MRRRLLLQFIIGSMPAWAVSAQVRPTRVVVGPNVLVSRVLDFHHQELMVQAAPWAPEVLIGTGIVDTRTGGRRNAVYTTTDGGDTWTEQLIGGHRGSDPQKLEHLSGDPQVGVGSAGTLLFVGLQDSLVVARSEDRGMSWSTPVTIGRTDHPQLVVDHTGGRFDGRAYIAGLACRANIAEYELCLWRSVDDGRTWLPPTVFEDGRDRGGYLPNSSLVLSDGTLVLPYISSRGLYKGQQVSPWWSGPGASPPADAVYKTAWLATSSDGGVTFTPRHRIHDASFRRSNGPGIEWLGTFNCLDPSFAVDTSGSHRDRLYMVWTDDSVRLDRVFVRHSDDRGRSWSIPALVDSQAPVQAKQLLPTITVNKDGLVGVTWYDTRASRDHTLQDEYFAASVDGGTTFLPAVRVSRQSSRRYVDPRRWHAVEQSGGDSMLVISVVNQPGDYVGLTTDARGVFHLFWEDARSGTQHIYTATVRLERPRQQLTRPAVSQSAIRSGGFRVEVEPLRSDTVARMVEMPVRVRNLMGAPLYAPVRLAVTVDSSSAMVLVNRGAPRIAASVATSVSYDLTPLLGRDSVLLPNERTGRIVLQLKATPNKPQTKLVIANLTFALVAGVPALRSSVDTSLRRP